MYIFSYLFMLFFLKYLGEFFKPLSYLLVLSQSSVLKFEEKVIITWSVLYHHYQCELGFLNCEQWN